MAVELVLVLIELRILGQRAGEQHQETRRAESALQGMVFGKAACSGWRSPPARPALHRRDRGAVALDGQHQARALRRAVDQHGARTADAVPAPDARAGQAQLVAQHVGQQAARFDVDLVPTPFTVRSGHRGSCSSKSAMARPTARRTSSAVTASR